LEQGITLTLHITHGIGILAFTAEQGPESFGFLPVTVRERRKQQLFEEHQVFRDLEFIACMFVGSRLLFPEGEPTPVGGCSWLFPLGTPHSNLFLVLLAVLLLLLLDLGLVLLVVLLAGLLLGRIFLRLPLGLQGSDGGHLLYSLT